MGSRIEVQERPNEGATQGILTSLGVATVAGAATPRRRRAGVKRILVGYDGSLPARRALAHAAELARPDDLVVVVNVMPEPGVSARIEPPTNAREHQRHLLEEAQQYLVGCGIDSRAVASVGHAGAEILAAAERLGADVIVVARRSKRAPHLLGSVSSHIVRSARCDVLVVHAADVDGADVPARLPTER